MNPSQHSNQVVAEVSVQLLASATASTGLGDFCQEALKLIATATRYKSVAIIRGRVGRWEVIASHPAESSEPFPADTLVSDAADSDNICQDDDWLVAPMRAPADPGWLLAIRFGGEEADELRQETVAQSLSALVGCCLTLTNRWHASGKRVKQLEATLSIAAKWHATLDPEELLNEIARTSTELFESERATIFLWNRKKKQLVGKPALGVKDGRLVIPDHVGVVGKVIREAEPLRADAVENQQLISRETDETLDFVTRSLLCVPIKGRNGKMLGAFELINRRDGSFTLEDETGLTELASHAASAIENSHMHKELLQTKSRLESEQAPKVALIGDSAAMQELRDKVAKVAATELAVLVLGENGTGKEVVSRMIHDQSDRATQPFVAVNCAALTETLLESELFGHEKGAFTDASETKAGKFETAANGTLFLDEVGELSSRAQAKLLRALELKTVTRVGGTELISTDARVVAATNRDLASMVRDGSFREDLFFRLNVVTIEIPPLREHIEDVVPLANHFLAQVAAKANRPLLPLSPEAVTRLESHHWPGNVRELRNLTERLGYLVSGQQIEVSDLGLSVADASGVGSALKLTDATKQFQSEYIEKQIAATGGSMTEAARRLGLHRSNLYRKMRQLGMQTDE